MGATAHKLSTQKNGSQKGKKKPLVILWRGHFNLPNVVTDHPDYIAMSFAAKSLLVDVGSQFNGRNNGDLCASMAIMKRKGWTSKDTLTRAKRELIDRGWLIETKVGGMNIGPSLYAISWQPIHECGGKLDVAPTTNPPRSLREK